MTILCNKLGPELIEIKVQDSGYGIKQEDLSKLFKLFGYLKRTKSVNSTGIGLGLYITKKIVEQFEGSVSVESEYGRGSTFGFHFGLSQCESSLMSSDRIINPNQPRNKVGIPVTEIEPVADLEIGIHQQTFGDQSFFNSCLSEI